MIFSSDDEVLFKLLASPASSLPTFIIYLCIWTQVEVRRQLGGVFSPSTVWVMELELRPSRLVANAFTW